LLSPRRAALPVAALLPVVAEAERLPVSAAVDRWALAEARRL
jgi:hypothetical protein